MAITLLCIGIWRRHELFVSRVSCAVLRCARTNNNDNKRYEYKTINCNM